MLADERWVDDPLRPRVRQKLSSVTILPPHVVPPDLVTLYSRVRYRVNQRPPTTRVMIHDAAQGVIGATLPITHPRGLALLGFAEGVTVTVPDMAGMPETISIEERSEEHTSELQSLMRISYAVFCLKKKKNT